ncbi:TetR/AcrR family transcriptional regulator [Colwellia sp. Arc7-635]|jgi:AcrR family transcriptional regulator|uniref:TetR/AcrR family transcriptional regulator n=1 Tax=Colwellia sp. Arc7-635 TaxID=2497879 RepID=UPI000F8577D7|nr:TetR/AcrR family transcriptional regulator [Colwellia sp. Arc7-635]AZQ85362.1 TetR/AcrR family transcriptional regulator [Colwellia sp. Arc7-635]
MVAKTKYHHGDLRKSLVSTATKMVTEDGIEGLSLRKLAERIGVSRTAAYHHFTDKNDLLCAIAEQGFQQWHKQSSEIFSGEQLSNEEKYRNFVHSYIGFATENPSLYDLMFGRIIWKENNSTQSLKKIAYASFNYQVEMTQLWQEQGIIIQNENTLRVAQVTWATLHGIARLVIDGIYAQENQIDEMCECAVNVFLNSSH